MMLMRNLPVRAKLTVIILLSSVAAITILGVLYLLNDYRSLQQQLSNDTLVLASVIADRSTAALSFDDPGLARENLAALELADFIERACIFNADYPTAFAQFHALNSDKTACPEPLLKESALFTAGKLHVHFPIMLAGSPVGEIYLQASQKKIYGRLLRGVLYMLGFGMVGIVLVYLLSRWLQRSITESLHELMITTSDIGITEDFSRRAKKQSEDEFSELVNLFNLMLDVIQKQNTELRSEKDDLEIQIKTRTQ